MILLPMDNHADTTLAIQRFLDDLAAAGADTPAEPIVSALLARSVNRLQTLCGSLLHRSYPRLTRGPSNLCTDELLSAVVERLMKAMRELRPNTVRQFFALANRHIRWELNDLARRLDNAERPLPLNESLATGTRFGAIDQKQDDSDAGNDGFGAQMRRILSAIDGLPEAEREAFNLVRLQGLSKAEAAVVLGVSEKAVQRRIARSLLLLTEALGPMTNSPPAIPPDQSQSFIRRYQ